MNMSRILVTYRSAVFSDQVSVLTLIICSNKNGGPDLLCMISVHFNLLLNEKQKRISPHSCMKGKKSEYEKVR